MYYANHTIPSCYNTPTHPLNTHQGTTGDPVDSLEALMRIYGIAHPINLLMLPPELLSQIPPSWFRELYLKQLGAPLRSVEGRSVGTREYSVDDYIRDYGVPVTKDGTSLNLNFKITNLQGIESIPNPEQFKSIKLNNNFLSNYVSPSFSSYVNPNTNIPNGAFSRFTNLANLWLNNNSFYTLPVGLFQGLNQLETLYLEHNQLSSLPEGIFQGLNYLKRLNLSYNQLSTLPPRLFEGLHQLLSIHLEYNQLSSLPQGIFQGLNQLRGLSLVDNQLQTLPEGLFQGLNLLSFLELDDNQLSSLPSRLFQGLDYLERLNLSNNQLSSLPEGLFQGLNYLERLNISYNQLCYSEEAFKRIQMLSDKSNLKFRLVFNPQRCSSAVSNNWNYMGLSNACYPC